MKASEFFLEFTLFAPFAGGVAVGHSRCGEFLLVDDKSLADALHWAMEHRCPVWRVNAVGSPNAPRPVEHCLPCEATDNAPRGVGSWKGFL